MYMCFVSLEWRDSLKHPPINTRTVSNTGIINKAVTINATLDGSTFPGCKRDVSIEVFLSY